MSLRKIYKYPVNENCTATVSFSGEITEEGVEMLIEHLKLFAKVKRHAKNSEYIARLLKPEQSQEPAEIVVNQK